MIDSPGRFDNLAGPSTDSAYDEPDYVRLYLELREAILNGAYHAGQKLPSTRQLARRLGMGRVTAVTAYELLSAEGLVSTRRGAGTFVNKGLTSGEVAGSADSRPLQLTDWGRRVVEAEVDRPVAVLPEGGIDFGFGRSFAQDFPYDVWRRLLARYLSTDDAMLSRYGSAAGYLPLRTALAEYLSRTRGIAGTADQIHIVNGAQQALDILSRLLLNFGDKVVVESPGYRDAYTLFRLHGAELAPLAVDQFGLPAGKLASIPDAKLAFVTPAHQFPRGGTMPSARRIQLLDWAGQSDAMIIEDDYDGDLRYAGRPLAALQSLDTTGRVIYLGTFSKVLFPALRLGYLVLPTQLVEPFSRARELLDRGAPTLTQAAVADFIAEGHFERHLRLLRKVYGRKRRLLVKSLESHMPGRLSYSAVEAGLHIMAYLESTADEDEYVAAAAEAGVRVYPGRPYQLESQPPPSILLGFSGLSDEDIGEGVRRLSAVWNG